MSQPDRRRRLLTQAGLLAALPAACAAPALRIEAAPPAAAHPRQPRSGDRWQYAGSNGFNRLSESDLHIELRQASAAGREFVWSSANGTALGVEIHNPAGQLSQDPAYGWPEVRFETPLALLPSSLGAHPGHLTRTRYRIEHDSASYDWAQWHRTIGWERIRVPAGEFVCLRIERLIHFAHPDFARLDPTRHDTFWHAPEIGRWVRREWRGEYWLADDRHRTQIEEDWRIWQMTSFVPAPVSRARPDPQSARIRALA